MGLGVLLVVGLGLFGASKVFGKKKTMWFGSTAAIGVPGFKMNEVGQTRRMLVANPSLPGSYTYETTDAGSTVMKYQPAAVAEVKFVGITKPTSGPFAGETLGVGKIVSIYSYEMTSSPSAKPSVGDVVYFD